MPRKHYLFPEHWETTLDPSLAYSDHLPILASVPLGDGNAPLNIISLNILGQSCSGVHTHPFEEKDEESKLRYWRIAAGLAESIRKQNASVILLQEAIDLMLDPLHKVLNQDEWEIIADKRSGLISAYRKDRLQLKSTGVDHGPRIRSMAFNHPESKKSIDVHNIWGIFEHFPNKMEKQFRETLTQTASDISVMIGDTNSRIAPLDEVKRNITTGIVPTIFNITEELDQSLQRSDYPDGGFYRDETGAIRQLETQVLDFASGEIVVDERSAEEAELWPEYRMVMCLDDSYTRRKVVKGLTVFEYEEKLKSELLIPELSVRMAADSFNNKALGIRFPRGLLVHSFIKNALLQEEGFQFIRLGMGAPDNYVFAPIEKVDLLYDMVEISALRTSFVSLLDQQIERLEESHLFFRDEPVKVAKLTQLREQMADDRNVVVRSAEELLLIIKQWESTPLIPVDVAGEDYDESVTTNKALMGVHRNVFFSNHRPGELTSTESLIQGFKYALAPNPLVLSMMQRLDQQIARLSESHWYFFDEPEKVAQLTALRDSLEAATPASGEKELLTIIENWEEMPFEDKDSSSPLINTNKALMGVHRNIFYRPEGQTSTQDLIDELKDELRPAALVY